MGVGELEGQWGLAGARGRLREIKVGWIVQRTPQTAHGKARWVVIFRVSGYFLPLITVLWKIKRVFSGTAL